MKNAKRKKVNKKFLDNIDGTFTIVQAQFNRDITDAMTKRCIKRLKELGAQKNNITLFEVPGALEIPYVINKISGIENAFKSDVLIAIGAVIKGDTYHFEIVSNESARLLSEIAIVNETPVINGILTTYTKEQAVKRIISKGEEIADAAAKMLVLDKFLNLNALEKESNEKIDDTDKQPKS